MLPVFWLCGASGVGKSVTAWALCETLAVEGVTVAYLDIDQLGMLYPATDDDPERYQLKAEALAALVHNYARAGAKVLIVSGVVDPSAPADVSVSYPGVNVTFCFLSVGDDVLRARILERGWDAEDADEAAEENAALPDAPFVSSIVDTSGRSVSEVVAQVRSYLSLGAPARLWRVSTRWPSRCYLWWISW